MGKKKRKRSKHMKAALGLVNRAQKLSNDVSNPWLPTTKAKWSRYYKMAGSLDRGCSSFHGGGLHTQQPMMTSAASTCQVCGQTAAQHAIAVQACPNDASCVPDVSRLFAAVRNVRVLVTLRSSIKQLRTLAAAPELQASLAASQKHPHVYSALKKARQILLAATQASKPTLHLPQHNALVPTSATPDRSSTSHQASHLRSIAQYHTSKQDSILVIKVRAVVALDDAFYWLFYSHPTRVPPPHVYFATLAWDPSTMGPHVQQLLDSFPSASSSQWLTDVAAGQSHPEHNPLLALYRARWLETAHVFGHPHSTCADVAYFAPSGMGSQDSTPGSCLHHTNRVMHVGVRPDSQDKLMKGKGFVDSSTHAAQHVSKFHQRRGSLVEDAPKKCQSLELIDGSARGRHVQAREETTLKLQDPVAPHLLRLWRDSCRDFAARIYAFAVPNEAALRVIAQHAPVVELGAGTGYWAGLLRARGVDVVAFDTCPTGGWKHEGDGACGGGGRGHPGGKGDVEGGVAGFAEGGEGDTTGVFTPNRYARSEEHETWSQKGEAGGNGKVRKQNAQFGVARSSPTQYGGRSAGSNQYHGACPPFTQVAFGCVSELRTCSAASLLLCYPPYGSTMARDAVVSFRGTFVLHVGEWWGDTGSAEFQRELVSGWRLRETVKLPNWGNTCYSLTVWERGAACGVAADVIDSSAQTSGRADVTKGAAKPLDGGSKASQSTQNGANVNGQVEDVQMGTTEGEAVQLKHVLTLKLNSAKRRLTSSVAANHHATHTSNPKSTTALPETSRGSLQHVLLGSAQRGGAGQQPQLLTCTTCGRGGPLYRCRFTCAVAFCSVGCQSMGQGAHGFELRVRHVLVDPATLRLGNLQHFRGVQGILEGPGVGGKGSIGNVCSGVQNEVVGTGFGFGGGGANVILDEAEKKGIGGADGKGKVGGTANLDKEKNWDSIEGLTTMGGGSCEDNGKVHTKQKDAVEGVKCHGDAGGGNHVDVDGKWQEESDRVKGMGDRRNNREMLRKQQKVAGQGVRQSSDNGTASNVDVDDKEWNVMSGTNLHENQRLSTIGHIDGKRKRSVHSVPKYQKQRNKRDTSVFDGLKKRKKCASVASTLQQNSAN